MTWRTALVALADPNAAQEAANPFYIPPQTTEVVEFFCAAAAVSIIPMAPFFLTFTGPVIGVLAVAGVTGAYALRGGLKARRYRLQRVEAVETLRMRLVRSDDTIMIS